MIKAVDLRKGRTVMYEDKPYVVHDATHVAKGNKASYMQAKLKNLLDGQIIDVRFRVEERLETPFLEDKEYEYLYADGEGFVLMDTTNFSACDVFLGAFKGWRNVTLMGTASAGGSGRYRARRLENSKLQVRLSSMASFRPNGKLYDGNGIHPDVVVEPIPTDFIGQTDSVLAAAVARLKRR